jgi:membrane protein implicated in regulation of membrane protease activity
MATILAISPFIAALILGLLLGVAAMMRGIDRHLERRGRVAPFNMPTVAAFLTFTGAVGYPVARYTELHPSIAWGIALASGLLAAVGVFWLLAGYIVPSAARDVEDERYRLQGHPACVTRAITADGDGEIEFEEHGVRTTVAARALSGDTMVQGAEVVIERVEDGVAHVELWSRIADELRLPA